MFRHDENVASFGPQDNDGVEAQSAVDADRRVDVVLEAVVVVAAIGDDVVVGNERSDHKRVVARLTLHAQHGLVAVNGEGVVTLAAGGGQRIADASAEPSARDLEQCDFIRVRREVDVLRVIRDAALVDILPDSHQIEVIARPFLLAIEVVEVTVRIGSEDLSDLERVLADAAVERGDRAVVIDEELVIAVTAADDQAAVHSAVVVDSFNRAGELRSVVGIEARLHQQGDEVLAQQEHIRRGSAVDRERVSPVIRCAGVMHVDEIIGPASGDVDEVAVGSTASVEVDGVANNRRSADRSVIRSIVRRGHRRQLVENDRVLPARESVGVTEDSRVPDQRLRTEVDAISITSTRENDRRGTQRAVDVDVRSGPRIGVAIVAVDFERSL